jgi:hypothetical protein
VAEPAELEKTRQHGHQDAGADQEHQGGDAPDNAVDGIVDGGNGLREVTHVRSILS